MQQQPLMGGGRAQRMQDPEFYKQFGEFAAYAEYMDKSVGNVIKLGEIRSKISTLDTEIKDLTEQKEAKERNIQQTQGNVKALEQRNEFLTKDIQSKKEESKALKEKSQALQDKSKDLNEQKADVARQRAINEKKRQQVQAMIDAKKKQQAATQQAAQPSK